jgi:hypothetical protein
VALDSWDLPLCSPPIPTPLPSDHWYSEVFRALPDLVCRLLPGLAGAEPGPMDTETAYSFRAVALKKVAHHPDGVLWPRQHPGGCGDSSSMTSPGWISTPSPAAPISIPCWPC